MASPPNFADGTQTGSTNAPCTAREITTPSSDGHNLIEILVDAFVKEVKEAAP
jgi:hypothetical protein